MKSRPQGRRSAGVPLAFAAPVGATLLAALAFAAGAAPAYAHGRHDLEIELFRGAQGPYELRVSAVPLVGFLEIAVTFEPGSPETRLDYNPRVVVTAARGEERLGPATASRVFLVGGNDYSATFAPATEGEWQVQVNIDSERGPAALALTVDVVSGDRFPWTALIAGLGLLLPILWLAWGAIAGRGRAARRGE